MGTTSFPLLISSEANHRLHWTTLRNSPGGFSESYSPMGKPSKISENLSRNLHKSSRNLEKSQGKSNLSRDDQKVQLASVFYLILQLLIRPTLEVAPFQGEPFSK